MRSDRVTCQESGPKPREETALQTENKDKITVAKVLEEPLQWDIDGIRERAVYSAGSNDGPGAVSYEEWLGDERWTEYVLVSEEPFQALIDRAIQLRDAQIVAELDRRKDNPRLSADQFAEIESFRDWLTQEVNNG